MSKKVLVIDDDPINIKYLSTMLADNGYEPFGAGDGVEGLKKAVEIKPDLVVLDVMMPKKSGFGVFGAMKKDFSLKNIPVIMLTSISQMISDSKDSMNDSTFEDMKDYYMEKMEKLVDKHRTTGDLRPECFLDKPIDPDVFLEAVVSLIGKAS